MKELTDLLLPRRCAACAAPAAGLCVGCLDVAEALTLADRGWAELADGVRAVGLFAYEGVVRDALRGMKAGGRHQAARWIGDMLRRRLELPAPHERLALTWVPSTRSRCRARGVELPRLLAGPQARQLLRRTAERPDQTSLGPLARRASPVGAFSASAVPPPAVVLVDDVRTTGATAVAAAGALREAGAARVLVATLAVGGDGARAGTSAGTDVATRPPIRSASGPGSASSRPT